MNTPSKTDISRGSQAGQGDDNGNARGPDAIEDNLQNPPSTSPQKNPLDKELDQYQTDDQLMRQKENRQKAEIYRGTRTNYSPSVKKWRQRQ